jgi:hypothetical protein
VIVFRWHETNCSGPGFHGMGTSSPTDELVMRAQILRARAEEVTIRAEAMHDTEAKEKMLRIAAQYNELAERLERAAAPHRS